MEQNLQGEKNDIDFIAAKRDEVLESIEETYEEDGANKLSDEELQQAILNGNVPTGIADAGASASCGKPSVAGCGRFTMDNDPFMATGRKLERNILDGAR